MKRLLACTHPPTFRRETIISAPRSYYYCCDGGEVAFIGIYGGTGERLRQMVRWTGGDNDRNRESRVVSEFRHELKRMKIKIRRQVVLRVIENPTLFGRPLLACT